MPSSSLLWGRTLQNLLRAPGSLGRWPHLPGCALSHWPASGADSGAVKAQRAPVYQGEPFVCFALGI